MVEGASLGHMKMPDGHLIHIENRPIIMERTRNFESSRRSEAVKCPFLHSCHMICPSPYLIGLGAYYFPVVP